MLAGTDPRLVFRRIADLFTGRDPAGGNVELTLDPAVQKAAMDGLNGVTGAVVALDPSTGAILGLASTPTFDPNQLSSHDPAAIRAYREQLTDDQTHQPGDRPALLPRLGLQGRRVGRRPGHGRVHPADRRSPRPTR